MRTAFIKELIEEAKKNKSIFLIVADLGFSVVEPFAEQFPDRFLNVGDAQTWPSLDDHIFGGSTGVNANYYLLKNSSITSGMGW